MNFTCVVLSFSRPIIQHILSPSFHVWSIKRAARLQVQEGTVSNWNYGKQHSWNHLRWLRNFTTVLGFILRSVSNFAPLRAWDAQTAGWRRAIKRNWLARFSRTLGFTIKGVWEPESHPLRERVFWGFGLDLIEFLFVCFVFRVPHPFSGAGRQTYINSGGTDWQWGCVSGSKMVYTFSYRKERMPLSIWFDQNWVVVHSPFAMFGK